MTDLHKKPPHSDAAPGDQAARVWDIATIFRSTAITYDAADKANGSLYLCDPTVGGQARVVEKAIGVLRAKSLWSSQDPKQVRDDQRLAYEQQLDFVEAREFKVDGATLVAVRCNHPKFPSDAERFSAWKDALASAASA